MTVALYEFPLSEKVRNYLRLEQLFHQLDEVKFATTEFQYLYFFEVLFDSIELMERIDLRSDFIRDIDLQEKNLVYWSQHPDIDSSALEQALQTVHRLASQIKQNKKLGSGIREEKFLTSIRQRFSIPGGATGFDLPSLFCWLKQPEAQKKSDINTWKAHLQLVENAIQMLLSFLRERGRFTPVLAKNGFYQGSVEDKLELVRVRCDNSEGHYPVLSGNKHRYGIKFMTLHPEEGSTGAIAHNVDFEIACC